MSDDKPKPDAGTEQGQPDQPPADHVPAGEPQPEDESQDVPPPDNEAPEEQPPDHVPLDQPPPDHVPPETEASPQTRSNIVEHLTSRTAWLRVLFMVLFVAIWSITRLVVGVVMVLQVLFLLIGGKRNARLAAFGQSLATYTYELVAYLTFASEDQPFPFSDWPSNAPLSNKPDSE